MWSDTIKYLGGIAGSLTAIITLGALLIKPIRNKIMNYIKCELGYNETKQRMDDLSLDIKSLYDKMDERDKQFQQYFKDQEQRNILNVEQQLYQLRQHINEIYLHYMPLGKIPVEVRENLLKGYNIYKRFGGNSYIERVVNELLELPVDV